MPDRHCSYYLALFICLLFSLNAFLIWSGHTFFSTESYNEWRFFEVVILFSLSIYYLFIPTNFIKHKSYFTYLIATILLLGLISSLQAHYISRALRDWALYSSFIIGCISLSHIIHKYPKLFQITFIFLCAMPLFFIFEFLYQAFFYLALPVPNKMPVSYTWTGQFNNPRIFADTALPLLFMLLAVLKLPNINTSQTYKRIFIFILFMLLVIFMFSSSRGALLSLIISSTFFYVLLPRFRFYFKKLFLYAGLCFVIGLLLLFTVGDNNITIARADSSGRTELIIQSIAYLKNHLLLGIGPSQFEHIKVPVSHPHNLFIQFIVEWGIIAGVAFIFLLLATAQYAINKMKDNQNQFNVFILLGVFSFIINCNFNGAHIYPSSQLYALFLISAVLSTYIKDNNNVAIFWGNLAKIIQCCIAITLVVTTYMALGCGNIDTSQQFAFGPRFWSYDSIHSDSLCPSASTFFNK